MLEWEKRLPTQQELAWQAESAVKKLGQADKLL